MTTSEYIILFNEQHARLLNFCMTYGTTKEEAEDIALHSFHVFWVKKDKIHTHAATTYLFTLAKNKCIDAARRKQIRKKVYSKLYNPNNYTDPIYEIEFKSISIQINEVIQSLPPKQKEYITMRYINDTPIVKIIQQRRDINRNTLKNTLQQAIGTIRKELKNRGIYPG